MAKYTTEDIGGKRVRIPSAQEFATHFKEDRLLYWTMGEPLEDTDIINRCRKESSYECRLKNSTLP
jgi:hypothetical protein